MDLHITLSDEQIAYLNDKLNSGGYASSSAVVSEALHLLERLERGASEVLRDAWVAGKASGCHGPIDFDRLRAEAREDLALARNNRAG